MRRKRLARVGKSLGVIVDRELLDALGFDASTPLELRVRDGVLVVARAEEVPMAYNGRARLVVRGDTRA